MFLQGDGTREGTGKCDCDSGYHGDLCDECKDGYFEESKNDTHTKCSGNYNITDLFTSYDEGRLICCIGLGI